MWHRLAGCIGFPGGREWGWGVIQGKRGLWDLSPCRNAMLEIVSKHTDYLHVI